MISENFQFEIGGTFRLGKPWLSVGTSKLFMTFFWL